MRSHKGMLHARMGTPCERMWFSALACVSQATPFRFGSWMGGDRDGNPNVTARVTQHVAALARWDDSCVRCVLSVLCRAVRRVGVHC